jgi:hypothetical protein
MKYILILLICFYSCINLDKDPKWAINTDIMLIQQGQCNQLFNVQDFITMSYEEKDIYLSNHNFEGIINISYGFDFKELYYKDFWNKKNLADSGNYLIVCRCKILGQAHCTN